MEMDKPKQTRACSLQDLRPQFAKAIRTYIPIEEEILVCYETTGVGTDFVAFFDTEKPVYSAQVISRKQLVLGWSSDNSNTITSIQLRDSVSTKEEQYNSGYWVTALGQGKTQLRCGFALPKMCQDFASILRKAIEQEKSASVSESQKLSLAQSGHNQPLVFPYKITVDFSDQFEGLKFVP